jgi:hypothetical protein
VEKPRLAISFSGGRSSAVMTKLCLDKYSATHEIVVTFANTGCEHPATLDFVKACDDNWGFNTVWLQSVISPVEGEGVRHKTVSYETASRNGEPFEAAIAKYGVPNPTNPWCTGRLKVDSQNHYLKTIGWLRGNRLTHKTAVGIRADEIDRMSIHAEKLGFVYPLVDAGITKAKVNAIMAEQPWDLKIPNDALGNCTWCWKKADRKLYTLAKTHPEVFEFPARMERDYGHIKAGDDYKATGPDGRRHFFRGHRDTTDIIKEANEKQGLILYTDAVQSSIFDVLLDVGGSCSDGCEIGADDDYTPKMVADARVTLGVSGGEV